MAFTWIKLAAAVTALGLVSGCAMVAHAHRGFVIDKELSQGIQAVSYTHLRAHET